MSGTMKVSTGYTPAQHDDHSRRFLALLSKARAEPVRAKKPGQQIPRGDPAKAH